MAQPSPHARHARAPIGALLLLLLAALAQLCARAHAVRCVSCPAGFAPHRYWCIKSGVHCGPRHDPSPRECVKRSVNPRRRTVPTCRPGHEPVFPHCYKPCACGFRPSGPRCVRATDAADSYLRNPVGKVWLACPPGYWKTASWCRTACPAGYKWAARACVAAACPPGTQETAGKCWKITAPCQHYE